MSDADNAPTPPPLFEDRHADFGLSPRAWDFVLTCYEPLSLVTGGIGTYSRLLLRLLSRDAGERNILLISAAKPDPRLRELLPNISIIVSPPVHHRHGAHIEDIGNDHMRFSFAVAETLWTLQRHGHSFRFIEFPDYGMEGYFSIKMRRHGQLRADRMTVRLHSPLLMLFEDNGDPLHLDDVIRRRSLGYELYCYRHADALTYGARPMFERIEAICRRHGVEIAARAVRLPHPKAEAGLFALDEVAPPQTEPRPQDRPLTICYVGRLENRKGIAQFFETVAAAPDIVRLIKDRNLQFHLVGQDLPHDERRSNGDLIRDAVTAAGLSAHVALFGYVDQQALPTEFLVHADAFVFPSIFENHPNALLETLPYGRPTLVSARGGMPEVAAPFPEVASYDPLAPDAADAIVAFLSALRPTQPDPQAREKFEEVARQSNAKMIADYFAVAGSPPPAPHAHGEDFSTAFVVPHFNASEHLDKCIESIRACARADDEIVVVDDASRPDEVARVKDIVARANRAGAPEIRLVLMERNGGPSATRNRGVESMKTAGAIQFLDPDDLIDSDGFNATREALRRNPDVDMVYGVQRSFGARTHFWFPTDANPATVLDENCSHSAVLIRKSAYEDIGGCAPTMLRLFEDWEFNARFCLAGRAGELVVALTNRHRVGHASHSAESDKTERLLKARQDLLSHLARCERVSGDPRSDLLIAGLAGYFSTAVGAGLASRAAGQDPDYFDKPGRDEIHVTRDATVRDLRERIKAQRLARWRKTASSLLLSLTRKLGGLEM